MIFADSTDRRQATILIRTIILCTTVLAATVISLEPGSPICLSAHDLSIAT